MHWWNAENYQHHFILKIQTLYNVNSKSNTKESRSYRSAEAQDESDSLPPHKRVNYHGDLPCIYRIRNTYNLIINLCLLVCLDVCLSVSLSISCHASDCWVKWWSGTSPDFYVIRLTEPMMRWVRRYVQKDAAKRQRELPETPQETMTQHQRYSGGQRDCH